MRFANRITQKISCYCLALLFVFILFPGFLSSVYADFNFEELEQLEVTEQDELLEQLRKAAEAWNFAEAEKYLKQASFKSYAPEEMKAARELIASNRQAYQENQERIRRAEEQRLEEQRKREQEEKRRLAARKKSRGNIASGSGNDLICVQIDSGCKEAFCNTSHLEVAAGYGEFSKIYSGAPSGNLCKLRRDLAGSYNYSVRVGDNTCHGSFYLSGSKKYLKIEVFHDCHSTTYWEN